MRRISGYVEDLLHGRRPRRFVPTDDEADALRAAIALQSAQPESAVARPEFLTELHARLAEQAAARDGEPGRKRAPIDRRRLLLAGAGAAAASAAAAVAVDRTIGVGDGPPASDASLVPSSGDWQTVLASADLVEGSAQTFNTGAVVGYLERTRGFVTARSAICTHQGCLLELNLPERRLDCPCHRTFFALDGMVLRSRLRTPPARLPEISVREREGQIQVYVPKE